MAAPVTQQDISLKIQTHVKSLMNKNTWTNREQESRDSERRLLFATNNEKLADTWVCLITYLTLLERQREWDVVLTDHP